MILFAFLRKNDYNSRIIKISLLNNNIALSLTINSLFFTDNVMHKIYEDKGKYDVIYQIPQILYSSFISLFIKSLLMFLSLTEKNVLEIKNKIDYKSAKKEKNKFLKSVWIKFMIFHILDTIFLLLFWFYISCFCALYNKTQLFLIKDFLISYATSNLYPFLIGIFPGIFRILSLKSKNKKLIMYKFSQILALIV